MLRIPKPKGIPMNEALETIEFKKGRKKYRILVKYDETPENPRTISGESPMGCFAIPKESRSNGFCEDEWDYTVDASLLRPLDSGKIPLFHGDPEDGLEPEVETIGIWPLGKGEHGPGTTQLYLGRFLNGDTWDSGQIGWVFATAKTWKEWQGTDWVDNAENQKKLLEIVEAELEEYACYVRGSCWRYEFEKWIPACEHGHGGEWTDTDGTFDGCGGFTGEYPSYGGAIEAACESAGIECPAQFKEKEVKAA